MDWAERLNAALEYLDGQLEGTASLEQAARAANCSLFHFSRMFEVVLGMGPAEYLRLRRLGRAALQISTGKERIIDIALRYGWESPGAFAKAFKRCFGISPSQARAQGSRLEAWPPLRVACVTEGGKHMKYRMVEKPAFKVAGVVLRTTASKNLQGDRLGEGGLARFWIDTRARGIEAELRKHWGPLGLLGITWDWHPLGQDNAFSYMIGIELPAGGLAVLPPDCEILEIPAARYAVFEGQGMMPGPIDEIWKGFIAEWYPASRLEHAGSPNIEAFPPFDDQRSDHESPECQVAVWIPVVPAGLNGS